MYMFKYVTKRVALMLLTFFIIFTMCFVLIKLLPIPTNVLPGQDPEIVMRTLEAVSYTHLTLPTMAVV